MKNILVLILFSVPLVANCQNDILLEQIYLDSLNKNSLNLVDSTDIYVNDGDSRNLFYYSLSPKDTILGTLVLFPPTWQRTEDVVNNNIELVKLASSNNILVIIPSINYNLYLDEISFSFINEVLTDVENKYSPPIGKYVFGGFSLGGMNAIRYTELAYDNESITTVKPIAVYGVDPPLDLARLYKSFRRTIEKNFSRAAVNEANNYINKFNLQFGGPPEEFSDVYINRSMYSKSEKIGGNAKYLASVPVRIYCDPDIDWQLKERRMDYYDMNAVDQTAMINQLLLLNNVNAEFVNSLGKGFRLDGRRHPHSWSLVDPEECVKWILKCIKKST